MLLATLIPYQDKLLVITEARDEARRRQAADQLAPATPATVPEIDPDWDPTVPGDMASLAGHQELILHGLCHGVLSVLNLSKPSEVYQGLTEESSAYYHQLLDAFRKYTSIDPTDPLNSQMVLGLFVRHFAEDIRKKFQKMDGVMGSPIVQLLEIAYKVYAN